MSEIRNVKLELLRSGPAHNQLLSPLTPYMALCGAEGPVTVNMPFEHAQLLARLERLRYTMDGVVGRSQREAELRELGEALGRVLNQVPALLSEISNARGERSELVHLRLSVAAYELALVPFELATGPDGYPGSGSPLFLQSIAPVTLTREIRRGQPLPVHWDRQPKILFAFATPSNLPPVPAQPHLEGLRRAVEPWVKWRETPEARIAEVTKQITILPNASLQKIRQACSEAEYTHVHILAHGELIEARGQYGLALCDDRDGASVDMVDGEALATALTARDSQGGARFRPTVVTLATCDSGNVASVVTAGGSIAHALHAGGIPWVIASQFPLWMRASSIAAEVLYQALLRGDDPRWVLHTLRQRLRTDSTSTHDWASIVAYAVVPWDFEKQVEAFRNRQTRQRIEVKFDEAEQYMRAASRNGTEGVGGPGVQVPDPALQAKLETIYDAIRHDLQQWRDGAAATLGSKDRAERFGMSAASEKRIGGFFHNQDDKGKAIAAYHNACELYKRAFEADPVNHWVVTQYLSMLAVLNSMTDVPQLTDLARDYGPWWKATRQIAEWQLRGASGETRAWSLGTLVELELLGAVYGGAEFDRPTAKSQISQFCRELTDIAGKDSFPVASTRRQFLRYRDTWPNIQWKDLADCAIEVLPDGESWTGRAYLGMHA